MNGVVYDMNIGLDFTLIQHRVETVPYVDTTPQLLGEAVTCDRFTQIQF